MPERVRALVHLAQGLHVDQVAVVAEQVAGAVGDRPDDRHAPAARRERQDPVVLDQDQRALGERAGGARLVGGERRRGSPRPGSATYGWSNSPRRNFMRSTRATSASSAASSTRPSARAASSGAPNADGPRQLGVDARHEREPRRLGEVVGQPVGGGDHLDADVVRRDDAVEAPLVAEDARRAARSRRGTARRPRRSRPASRSRSRTAGRPPRTGTAARRAARARRCGPAPGSCRPRPARGRPCAWRSR